MFKCMENSFLPGALITHDSSSCIYSVENQIGTLSSSSYQLRLRVDLSCLG